MNVARRDWLDIGLRGLLSVFPLLVGLIIAFIIIIIVLALEGNVTDTTVQSITLTSEDAARDAQQQLAAGKSASQIAGTLGDAVDEFDEEEVLTPNQVRGLVRSLPDEESEKAFETIFGVSDAGTIVGPYETRTGWYVARIEKQSVVTLPTIYREIRARMKEVNRRTDVINFWFPIMLCSCGLLVTFTAGLWNIGIEGQMTMGAVAASGLALFSNMPRTQQLAAEIGLAAAAGGAWALLTAMLKTRGGVNEIFGGVAMNFIATNYLAYLVVGPWGIGSGSSTDNFPAHALLPSMENYRLSPITLYLVIAVFVGVLLLLTVSKWGLQLRAMGKNPRSAQILGVPTERHIWTAMALCGMMAGMAGAHLVLFTQRKLPANVSGGIGFLALLVVLLASSRVYWVPFIGLAFAFMFTTGGLPLWTRLQLDSSLSEVFLGLLVFIVFIFNGVRQRIQEWLDRRKVLVESIVPPPPPSIDSPGKEVQYGSSAD